MHPASGEAARVIRVRAFPDPLSGPPVDFTVPWGSTIAEIVESIPLIPEHEARRAFFEVSLGGHVVPQDKWHRVKPSAYAAHQPVVLQVYIPLRGGGGGGKILRTLAAIALVTASLFLTPFLTPIVGSFWASAITAAVGIGGALLLQGLSPQPAMGGGNFAASRSQAVGVAGGNNTFSPGSPLPRVLGIDYIFPPMVVPPFTTTVGHDQYVTAVYGLAGPHQWSSVKIGDVSITGSSDIEDDERTGNANDTNLQLVTETIIESNVGLRMSEHDLVGDPKVEMRNQTNPENSYPAYHRIERREGAHRFTVNFVLDRGLGYADVEATEPGVVPVGIYIRGRFRRKGTTTWTNLPRMLFRGNTLDNLVRCRLTFKWVGSLPSNSFGWPIVYDSVDVRYEVSSAVGWSGLAPDDSSPTVPSDWRTILTSSGKVYYKGVTWTEDELTFNLLTSTYRNDANDAYEFEFQRSTPAVWPEGTPIVHTSLHDWFESYFSIKYRIEEDIEQYRSTVNIQSVQSVFPEYPINRSGVPGETQEIALLAIKAKNMQLDRVSCIARGLGPTWTGSAWSWTGTVDSNPAAKYLEVLKGSRNGDPVPDALIDYPALQDWYEFCEEHEYFCNFTADGRSVLETLQLIAMCGHASPIFGASYSVAIDRVRTVYAGMITQRNASNFRFEKALSRRPHALRVAYRNSDRDYDAREITVYDEGYTLATASRWESVFYEGLTTETEARDRANLDLKWARYRSSMHKCTMDVEHLEFQRGDLVLWETDIVGTKGGRGRINAINQDGGLIQSIDIDERAHFGLAEASIFGVTNLFHVANVFELSAARGVSLRLDDGSVVTHEIDYTEEEGTRLVFKTPFAMPTAASVDILSTGGLAVMGPLTTTARDVLIWAISPSDDLQAEITAVDYAGEDVYGVIVAVASPASIAFSAAQVPMKLTIRMRGVAAISFDATAEARTNSRANIVVTATAAATVTTAGMPANLAIVIVAATGAASINGQVEGSAAITFTATGAAAIGAPADQIRFESGYNPAVDQSGTRVAGYDYSTPSLSIGPSSADRIIVFALAINKDFNTAVSGVQMVPNTGSPVVMTKQVGAGVRDEASIWACAAPDGETATFDIEFGSSGSFLLDLVSAGVFSMRGRSGVTADDTGSYTFNNNGTTVVDGVAGSVLIYLHSESSSSENTNFTGVTDRAYWHNARLRDYAYGFTYEFAAPETARTISGNKGSSIVSYGAVAVWNPL